MNVEKIRKIVIAGAGLLLVTACSREPAATAQQPETTAADPMAGVVEIVTRDFTIQAPDELPTGWNQLHFTNEGKQTHFVVIYRMPEGKTIDDQLRETVPAFETVMAGLRSGELTKADIGKKLGELAPAWVWQLVYVGGVGLLAPGGSETTTIHLDTPGTYLLECYMKGHDGRFHSSMGMLKQVQVVEQDSGLTEPEGDVVVSVGDDGIVAPDSVAAGRHVFKVEFTKDAPDTPLPYDVHLARLDDSSQVEKVAYWMDWTNIGGLKDPAPVTFLGGVENMKAGNRGYLDVELAPGRYLWVSEMNADRINKTFTVE